MPNISRREFLAASAAGASLTADTPKRPNFIFYMPETLRAESLACYGHPVVKTPNFDRLASQGTRFVHCQTQNSVCGPSRVSFATGWPVHVRGHRSLYYFLHQDEPNLFRYLKQSGYDVFWYGKNDMLAPECFPESVTEWGSRPGKGKGGGRNPFSQDDPHFYSFLNTEGGDRRDTGDYANVQAAIQVLERADKPFCIYLPLAFVHPPFTAPRDFYSMYDPAKLPPLRPINLPRKPNFYDAIRKTRRLDRLTDADFRKIQAVYLGMISYSDWMLGELLEAVERTKHADDTCVFVFSDHGEWGGDYGLVEKWPSACDDVLTHVPLIARVPIRAYPGENPAGHVSEEPVELYDVMATTLYLAGLEVNEHTHFARNLMPQINGQRGDPLRATFCEGGYNINERQCFEPLEEFKDPAGIYYPKVHLQNEHPETCTRATAIRALDHKMVLRPDGQSELYDLKKDPLELDNVFGDRTYAGKQEELLQLTLDWYIRTADVAPKKHDPRGFPKRAA
jgi:choline-sulfatase